MFSRIGMVGLVIWLCLVTTACWSADAAPAVGSVPKPAPKVALHNEAKLFAVSPIYTIFPDGKVGELTDGNFDALTQQNGYFDASRQTLLLQGVRNQEVAVQIVIPVVGNGFAAQAGELQDIPANRISFSLIAYSQVIGKDAAGKTISRLMPDVIIPLDGSVAGIKNFSVPQSIKGLADAGNKQGLLLMEIWIPKTATPGLHKGSVSVR
ncbi:MAG TPA: hypothetical protein VL860_13065, partial [Planctomycetota bacterium]|nr:hypothetical protein [Planctomycetota bacterium]